jgi:glycosyltransferase involved in cell wall biosynthesis
MTNEISAVLIVRNEAHRIAYTVGHLRPLVDEIVVVDQSSDDGTKTILQELVGSGLVDTLILEPNHGTPEPSRPVAIAAAKGPWVLLIDADERLTESFQRDLREMLDQPTDFYYLPRTTYVDEACIENAVPHSRLFRKGAVEIEVHSNLGLYAHSSCAPKEGMRVSTYHATAILHAKTGAEQAIDDERSDRLMNLRPPELRS